MSEIYDCFLFNDEIEILCHRLNVLGPVVTKFVLVEAGLTHQGDEKPLHFLERRDVFEPWLDQIVHVEAQLPRDAEPRERERAQHEPLGRVAAGLDGDALVLVGDVDEIPFPEVVEALRAELSQPTRLHMTWSMYRANLVLPMQWDDGTFAFLARDHDHPALSLVLGRPGAKWRQFADPARRDSAGWHLSWLGNHERFRDKVLAYPHAEFRAERYTSRTHVERLLRFGVDFLGRGELRLVPVDELPNMVRQLGGVDESALRQEPLPGWLPRKIYLSFTRLRPHAPDPVNRWFDNHSIAFMYLAGPVIMMIERGLALARRARRSLRRE